MKAVICPVCEGVGKLPIKDWSTSTTIGKVDVCHGCIGKGWVTVPEDTCYQPIKKYGLTD